MVVEQLIPSPVVANVEQAGGRAAQTLALAPEGLGGVLFEPAPQFGAKFFLFRRVGEIHRMLRLIVRAEYSAIGVARLMADLPVYLDIRLWYISNDEEA